MLTRIELPAHERGSALTDAERADLEAWAARWGNADLARVVRNYLHAAPRSMQRQVIDTATWGQIAEFAGVRLW